MPAPTLVVAAALVEGRRVLAARRTQPAGRWEFPGGKREPGEQPLAALQRELAEELGITAIIVGEIRTPSGVWPINDRLVMRIWYARPLGMPRCRGDHDALAWCTPDELTDLDWLPADVPIAARIAADLQAIRIVEE